MIVCGCAHRGPGHLPSAPPVHGTLQPPVAATFSIVALDPATDELGVAVASKFFNVGTVVPWAKAKVGAIATQSYANVSYGVDGLTLLASGKAAKETLAQLTGADRRRESRQVGIVDAEGRSAAFSGSGCNLWAGHREGKNFSVQGNLLTGPEVLAEIEKAFEEARHRKGTRLADWLMAAMLAGEKAGGDKRGKQSAALLVVREQGGFGGSNDRFIDLRVEDHAEPLQELSRLLEMHKKFFGSAHQAPPLREKTP